MGEHNNMENPTFVNYKTTAVNMYFVGTLTFILNYTYSKRVGSIQSF